MQFCISYTHCQIPENTGETLEKGFKGGIFISFRTEHSVLITIYFKGWQVKMDGGFKKQCQKACHAVDFISVLANYVWTIFENILDRISWKTH